MTHDDYKDAPIGLCRLDADLRYLAINNWLAAINGLTIEEHLGRRISDVLSSPAAVLSQLRQVLETGEPIIRGEACIETPTHPETKRYYEHSYYPDKSDDGTVVAIRCVVQDVTERRRIEAALRESEERLELAVAATNDSLWDWHIAAGTGYWSPRFYTMLGYEVGELEITYDVFQSLVHPDDRANSLEAVRAHLEDRVPYDTEFRLRTKSGEYRWYRGRGQAVWDETNNPQRMVGFNEDITERRQLQAALRETQQLLDSTPDPMVIVSDKGDITFVNSRIEETFGFNRAELLGKPVEVLIPERFHSQHRPRRTEFFSDPHVRAMGPGLELYGRRKDGSEFPVEISLSPIKTEAGLFVAAAIRDITKRKQAEQQQQKLVALVENSSDFIGMASLDNAKVLYINPAGRRMVGLNGSAELGRATVADFYSEATYAELRDAILPSVLKTGTWEGELQLRHFKTGDPIDVEARIFVVKSPSDGGVLCLATVMRDIREHKRLEAEPRQAQKLEAIGVLAGGIAHDFNNILTSIIGFTSLTQMGMPEGSENRENLEQVLKASDRATGLVRQILAFSRQGQGKPERKPMELAPIVQEALKLLRASLPSTIEMRQSLDQDCGSVLGEPTQIHQLVMNLCTNAYQAMRASGGILEVSLTPIDVGSKLARQHAGLQTGPHIRLTVRDNGPGIDPAIRERIFDPFFTTKKAGEGTGLGLSVAHGIVRSHGGAIDVQSAPGGGTEFFVYLPRDST